MSFGRLRFLRCENGATKTEGATVTGGFFPMLDVSAHLGRILLERDEQPGSEQVAVLSYGFWRDHFARDPDVLGKELQKTVSQRTTPMP